MADGRRKDSKGRILRNGEQQRADGRYMYTYIDPVTKEKKYVFSWKFTYFTVQDMPIYAILCQNRDIGKVLEIREKPRYFGGIPSYANTCKSVIRMPRQHL